MAIDIKAKKTGKKTWRPATMLEVRNLRPGLHAMWAENDPANLDKLVKEDWQFATKNHFQFDKPNAATVAGKKDPVDVEGEGDLTSLLKYRELVLMCMDDETFEARKEYFENQTNMQDVDPSRFKKSTAHLMSEAGLVDSSSLYDIQ